MLKGVGTWAAAVLVAAVLGVAAATCLGGVVPAPVLGAGAFVVVIEPPPPPPPTAAAAAAPSLPELAPAAALQWWRKTWASLLSAAAARWQPPPSAVDAPFHNHRRMLPAVAADALDGTAQLVSHARAYADQAWGRNTAAAENLVDELKVFLCLSFFGGGEGAMERRGAASQQLAINRAS